MLNFKSTGGSGAVKYEQIIYYFYSKHTNLFSVKKSECYINFKKKQTIPYGVLRFPRSARGKRNGSGGGGRGWLRLTD